MKVALSGTPGTGKTAISTILSERYGVRIIDLNGVIRTHRYYAGWDDDRSCSIVDLIALKAHPFPDGVVLEGHLSHHLAVDRVIVLRTNPVVLRTRLHQKGFSNGKVDENVQAEILDVVLIEALAANDDKVYELESTGALDQSAQLAWEIIQGQALERFVPGRFDWTGYLE
jgi:adenylate kinase